MTDHDPYSGLGDYQQDNWYDCRVNSPNGLSHEKFKFLLTQRIDRSMYLISYNEIYTSKIKKFINPIKKNIRNSCRVGSIRITFK